MSEQANKRRRKALAEWIRYKKNAKRLAYKVFARTCQAEMNAEEAKGDRMYEIGRNMPKVCILILWQGKIWKKRRKNKQSDEIYKSKISFITDAYNSLPNNAHIEWINVPHQLPSTPYINPSIHLVYYVAVFILVQFPHGLPGLFGITASEWENWDERGGDREEFRGGEIEGVGERAGGREEGTEWERSGDSRKKKRTKGTEVKRETERTEEE